MSKIQTPHNPDSSDMRSTLGVNKLLVALLVIIQVLLLLWSALDGALDWEMDSFLNPHSDILIRAGALYLPALFDGQEWWRLLSCAFLHGPWFHLIFNLLALHSIGQIGEGLWGSKNHLVIFLGSSIGASLLSMAVVESPLVVGASGGIFGLGAALIFELRRRIPVQPGLKKLSRSLTLQIGGWLLLGLAASAWSDVPISAYGHLGGAVFGTLIWGLLQSHQGKWLFGFGLFTYVGICCTGWNARWRPQKYEIALGLDAAIRDDCETAAEKLTPWLATNLDDAMLLNTWAYCEILRGGDLQRALSMAERANALEPNDANILDTLGWAHCHMGDVEKGQHHLTRAIEIKRDDPVLIEHLNRCKAPPR